jgi:DNA-binding IclR family transcriptional regulator
LKTNADTINSIDRALDILLLLYSEDRELGVTEIGSLLGVYKSTIYRTLSTLENKGFVQQDPVSGKYWLGVKTYAIGMVAGKRITLKQIAQPFAMELSEKFKEVVNVSILDTKTFGIPKTIIVLRGENKKQILKVQPDIGSSTDFHCSSVGKCIVAFSPKEVLENVKNKEYTAYTENTVKNWEELYLEVEKIRKQGYALDNEELEIGLSCIACPILDNKGEAIAAISISGPTSRITALDFNEVVKELKNTAEKISNLLN